VESLTEHEVIGRISSKVPQIGGLWQQFDVTAAAVDLLLVFDAELQHQRLPLGAERLVQLSCDRVEFARLAGFDPCRYVGSV